MSPGSNTIEGTDMLSRKHYTAVAAEIVLARNRATGTNQSVEDKCFDEGWKCALEQAALGLARVFASDNPSFDRQRFLAACGLFNN